MVTLAGLSAVPSSFQSAQANMYSLLQQQQQQDALKAYGQALAALAGQQGPIPTSPVLNATPQPSVLTQTPSLAPARASTPSLSDALAARGFGDNSLTAPAKKQSATAAAPSAPSFSRDATNFGFGDSSRTGLSTLQPQPPGIAVPSSVTRTTQPAAYTPGAPQTLKQPGLGLPAARSAAPPVALPGVLQTATVGQPRPAPTSVDQFKPIISQMESGGDYHMMTPANPQPGQDFAAGKYQVMASNVPSWTQETPSIGRAMTVQEFLNSPDAQEKVFEYKFGQYLKERGPQGAALAWFAGPGGTLNSGPDSLGTTPAAYVNQFNQLLGNGAVTTASVPGGTSALNLPDVSGVAQRSLTWPTIVNAIQKANPGISPQALAGATNMFTDFMTKQSANEWKAVDEQRSNYEAQTARLSEEKSGQLTAQQQLTQGQLLTNVDEITQGVLQHLLPPPGTTNSSRFYSSAVGTAVAAKLAGMGHNVAADAADYTALQKMIGAQNSPVVVRTVGAIDATNRLLDTFKQNVDAWNAAGLPTIVNAAVLDQALKGQLVLPPNVDPQAAQKQAALLKTQYADLIPLIASVFQAGGVPTYYATDLAKEQLDLGWSAGTLDAVIEQIRGNLAQRLDSIRGVQPYTPGATGPNSYATGGGTPGGTTVQSPIQIGTVAPEGTLIQYQDGSYRIKQNGQWVPYTQ